MREKKERDKRGRREITEERSRREKTDKGGDIEETEIREENEQFYRGC